MRRMRKQPRGVRGDWSHGLEPGDRVYAWVRYGETAVMDDLVESRGRHKSARGC